MPSPSLRKTLLLSLLCAVAGCGAPEDGNDALETDEQEIAGNGLTAEYFDQLDFTQPKVTRVDPRINFDWGTNAPDASMGADTFSVRWTGQVKATVTGVYTFSTRSDDGVRLVVNGQTLVNNWTDHGLTTNSGRISLVAGQRYDLQVEYYENMGRAAVRLLWTPPGRNTAATVPNAQLFPSTEVCSPSCSGKTCGADGCGGVCGTCSNGTCNASGQCEASTTGSTGSVVIGSGSTAMTFPEKPGLTVPESSLVPYTGPRSFSSGTYVFENCLVTGGTLDFPQGSSANVTFRNCKFRMSGWRQMLVRGGTAQVTLEHVLVDGTLQENEPALHLDGVGKATVRLSECINVANCLRAGNNTLVEWNWFHIDGFDAPGTDAHADTIEIYGGKNITIQNNHLTLNGAEGQTGALNITADFGAIDNVVVENNTFSGGTYSLYLRGDGYCSCGNLSNIRVRNNRWKAGSNNHSGMYGEVSYQPRQGLVEWTNNTLHLTSGAVQAVSQP